MTDTTDKENPKMIYAAVTEKTDNALTVGADDNRPLVPVVAFANKADFQEYQDGLWMDDCYTGDNLIRVSRKDVEGWFGKHFSFADYSKAIMGGISIAQVCREREAQ